jgi:hypothetical protein
VGQVEATDPLAGFSFAKECITVGRRFSESGDQSRPNTAFICRRADSRGSGHGVFRRDDAIGQKTPINDAD